MADNEPKRPLAGFPIFDLEKIRKAYLADEQLGRIKWEELERFVEANLGDQQFYQEIVGRGVIANMLLEAHLPLWKVLAYAYYQGVYDGVRYSMVQAAADAKPGRVM